MGLRRPHALAALAFLVLAAVLVRVAWVGDDAFITLRTVENLANGHGPVWNTRDRVQTYTHPSWMLLLTGARLVTGELYFGTLAVSFVCALAAALVLARTARHAAGAAAVLALLVFSRAFTDYGVSGLENPLVFLLAALLARELLAEPRRTPERRLLVVALLAAGLALTRLDLAALALPAVLASVRGVPTRRALRALALGFAPLAAWLAFAAFYYGSPFPITAHAKAFDTGISAGELWRQGGWYVVQALRTDPLTPVVVAAGIALGLARRAPGTVPLAIGALLYTVYVVKIGGDFMAWRFLTPPFVVAVAVIGRMLADARPRTGALVAAAAGALLLVPGLPAWVFPPSHDEQQPLFHGISDERQHYYSGWGLLAPERDLPPVSTYSLVLASHGRTRLMYEPGGAVGGAGVTAGPLVHIVDPWILDPLLMRLPLGKPGKWRIGHVERAIPVGYHETLAYGEDHFQHAGLARYHANLRRVIEGPLVSRERFAAMWHLWTGTYDDDLADFVATRYRTPERPVMPYERLATELGPSELGTGPWWFDEPQSCIVYAVGLEVRLPAPVEASRIDLQISGGPWLVYRFTLLREGREVGVLELDAQETHRHWGMLPWTLEVPPGTPAFDAILVEAPESPPVQIAALGSLRVTPR